MTVKWARDHVDDPDVIWEGLRKAGLPEDEGPRLSIVVLPFQNLSGDAKQDYLADVLTDELTTYISRIPGNFVIARNTAFTYKGKPTDVKTIGKELGVRYALEGSVQPTDKRIRTNAQLIDTETGAHLWAEQFDTDKTDLLQTEDEIVTRLARTLQIQLVDIEAAKLQHAHPDNPDAQDLALQCEAVLQHAPAGNEAAADYGSCERALALDPNNVLALQGTAHKLWARLNYGQSTDRPADFKAADDLITRGLAIDPNNAHLFWVKSLMLALEHRFQEASAAAARSIALDPSDIDVYWNECLIEYLLGQPDKVSTCIDQALRLSPHDIRLSVLLAFKGNAHFMKQEYVQSIEWYDRSFALNPDDPLNNIYRIGALSLSSRDADARKALARYLSTASARSPKTIAAIRKREISDNPLYLSVYDHLFAGLRKTGMPEQ